MFDRPTNSRCTRSVVQSLNGMVASSQPLASAAGLEILMEGGNAFDAAVAMAATLCVVEPFSTGLGGDVFVLAYDAKRKKLFGLNGSGRSPHGINLNKIKMSYPTMPERGIHSVTVPGTVDGWTTLIDKYGTLSLSRLLQSAIKYAEEGYPVSDIIGSQWQRASEFLLPYPDSINTYLCDGKAPLPGQIFKQSNLATSLKKIANGGRDAFYKGDIAEKIIKYCNENGGTFSIQDFENHKSEWVQPISTRYQGYEVFELPPNSQGLCVLLMLNILSGYDMQSLNHNSAEYLHLIVEAKKLSFNFRNKFIGDRALNELPIEEYLSEEYAKNLRDKISFDKAMSAEDSPLKNSDTVYLCTADNEGNCVSFINSIYRPFGSGMVAGNTGIILQNRGALFSLEKDHFNVLGPHKRPLHTLIPAIVMKKNKPILCFGVMGGDMQPQGHIQIILNMVHFGMNVQEAGEAARVCHMPEGISLESGIGYHERYKLMQKGHTIIDGVDVFGGYQGIFIDHDTGVLHGGSDPRKDGCAIGF